MKIKFTFLLFIVLASVQGESQELFQFDEPILWHTENDSLGYLDIETIRFERKLIFKKLASDKDTVEYYSAGDSSFYYRNFSGDKITDYGLLTFSKEISRSDTVVSYSAETYEEIVEVISYHELVKTGEWYEFENDSVYWHGNYDNGKKIGRWFSSRDGINYTQYGEFKHGQLVKLYWPSLEEISNYINWLTRAEFHFCTLWGTYNDEGEERLNWSLSVNIDKECHKLAVLIFRNDGSMSYQHNSKYVKNEVYPEDGTGQWSWTNSGNLKVEFSNGDEILFSIQSISNKDLELEVLPK